MPILFRIALRNLRQHMSKTIIICGLIALGMFLLVIGNSLMETALAGIEKSFVKNFSGHILVGPVGDKGQDPDMWPGSGFDFGDPQTVQNYQQVFDYLQKQPEVLALNPQVASGMRIDINEQWRARVNALAFNTDYYEKMFPGNYEIIQGSMLAPDQEGCLITEKVWNDVKQKAGITWKLGDLIKLVSFTPGGLKIKELKLVGIFRFKSSNSSIESVVFTDLSSLRYLKGFVVGAADEMKLAPADTAAIDDAVKGTGDDFFGSEPIVTNGTSKPISEKTLNNLLGDTSTARALNKADAGAWSYILLRLHDSNQIKPTILKLNDYFKTQNWNIRAVDWQTAAGAPAKLAVGAQLVFTILVIIICIVSIFIIMNTMIVSTMERTAEIGTMRALGAQKGYIRQVFTLETMALSLIGGLIGLFIAIVLIIILNITGVPAFHPLLEILFGGKILYPVLSVGSTIFSMVLMLAVGFLSSIYPTMLAMRVQPIKAMQA